jgi:hypothetical protein
MNNPSTLWNDYIVCFIISWHFFERRLILYKFIYIKIYAHTTLCIFSINLKFFILIDTENVCIFKQCNFKIYVILKSIMAKTLSAIVCYFCSKNCISEKLFEMLILHATFSETNENEYLNDNEHCSLIFKYQKI